MIRKKGNPLIQFLLSISPRFWIRLFKDQRSTSSQHVKMKGQSKQSKGLVKTEKAFRCNDPKGQMIQSFFSQEARKIQLQGSSYNSAIMDSLEFMFTRYLAIKFNHAYPRTEQLRIIKEASCYVCLT